VENWEEGSSIGIEPMRSIDHAHVNISKGDGHSHAQGNHRRHSAQKKHPYDTCSRGEPLKARPTGKINASRNAEKEAWLLRESKQEKDFTARAGSRRDSCWQSQLQIQSARILTERTRPRAGGIKNAKEA
jgi:hypothetical protein